MSNDSNPGDTRLLSRLADVCSRFQQERSSGIHLPIEHYLESFDGRHRSWAVRELIRLELLDLPSTEWDNANLTYRQRFPNHSRDIDQVFAQLRELTLDGRDDVDGISFDSDQSGQGPGFSGSDPNSTIDLPGPGDETPVSIDLSQPRLPNEEEESERVMGDYLIIEPLGRGGMGMVYKALQRSAGRQVALKVIRADRLSSLDDAQRQSVIERFKAEAQATAQLDHPNLVTIFDVGSWRGEHYYSMTFVNGPSLSQLLREGPLENVRAARYTRAVASAVHAAHQQGILHRDLKPHNVMIEKSSDRAMVADFGLAKLLEIEQSMTRTGDVLGSPPYMSPEQTRDASKVAIGTDVYGIGATLYHLITGRPPFQAGNVVETIRLINEEDPVAPRRLNPAVDADLETICLKCLEKEPARRYESAEAVAEDLGNYLSGNPIAARPVSQLRRFSSWCNRNPRAAILSGASLFLTATLMVVLFASYLFASAARDRERVLHDQADELARRFDAEAEQNTENLLSLFEVVNENLKEIVDDQNIDETLRKSLLNAMIPALEKIVSEDLNEPRIRVAQANAYRNLAFVQQALGQTGEAHDSMTASVELWKQLVDAKDDADYQHNLAAAYVQLGNQQADTNQTAQALQSLEQGLKIYSALQSAQPDNLDRNMAIASIYANLAVIKSGQRGQAIEACQDFEKALEIQLAIEEKDPNKFENLVRLTRLYQNYGNSLVARQKLTEAETAYRTGLEIANRDIATRAKRPDLIANRADLDYSLAVLLQDLRKNREAEALLRLALEARVLLASRFPDNYLYQLRLAETQEALGFVRYRRGDNKEAIKLLDSAIDLSNDLLASYSDPRIRERLSSILDIRATVISDVSTLSEKIVEEAAELYARSRTLRQQLVEDYPKIPHYQKSLASSFFNLGLLYDKADKSVPAEQAYLSALKVYRTLMENAPQVPVYALNFSECVNNLANLYIKTGRSDEGNRFFREMIPLLGALPESNPMVQFNLAKLQMNFGEQYEKANKDELAAEYFDEAIERFKATLEKMPQYDNAQILLTSSLVDRAELCGRLGQIEQGRALWQEAIAFAPWITKPELLIRQTAWLNRYRAEKAPPDDEQK